MKVIQVFNSYIEYLNKNLLGPCLLKYYSVSQ